MRTTRWISTVLFVLAFCTSGIAQTSSSNRANPEHPTVSLPKGDSAWALHVVRSGGLTGGSVSDITIMSDGTWICGKQDQTCKTRVASDVLKALRPLVLSAKISKIRNRPPVLDLACYECDVIAMTLRRRESGGKERTYSADWDPVTAANVSEDLVRIARIALDGK